MADEKKTVGVVYKIEVDDRALAATKNAAETIMRDMEKISGATVKTTESYKRLAAASTEIGRGQAVDSIVRQFATLGRAIGSSEDALIQLRRTLKEIGSSEDDIRRATLAFREMDEASAGKAGGGGQSRLGTSLTRAGGALRGIGLEGIGGPLQQAGDILDIRQEASSLITALGPLAPLMAAGAGAAIGYQVGLKVLDAQLAAIGKTTENASSQLKLYHQISATNTTEEIKARIKVAEQAKQNAEQEVKTRENSMQGAEKQIGDPGWLQLAKDIAKTRPEYQALQKDLDSAKDAATNASNELEALKQSLDSSGVAANDAAARIEKLNEKFAGQEAQSAAKFEAALIELRAKEAKAADDDIKKLDARYQFGQQVQNLAENGRQKDLDAMLKANEEERAWNRTQIMEMELAGKTTGAYAEKLKQLKDRNELLVNQHDIIIDQATEAVAANEARIKAEEAALKAGKAFVDNIAEAAKTANELIDMGRARNLMLQRRAEDDKISAARKGIEADYKQRIDAARQAEELEQRESEAQADYDERRSEVETKYMETSLKALADFRDEEARTTKANDKKRLRAIEDLNDRLTSLAAHRDVAGFIEAQREGEKQLKRDAEDADEAAKQRLENYAKQANERERAYRDEQRTLKKQLDERLEKERQAGEKRISQADRLERELQNLRDQWAVQDMARARQREQEDYDEKFNALVAHQQTVMGAIAAHYTDQLTALGTFAQQARDLFTGVTFGGAAGGSAAPASESTYTPPPARYVGGASGSSFAKGSDFIPRDGWAYLHRGERVVTAAANRADGGPTVVIQNLNVGRLMTQDDIDRGMAEGVKIISEGLQRSGLGAPA